MYTASGKRVTPHKILKSYNLITLSFGHRKFESGKKLPQSPISQNSEKVIELHLFVELYPSQEVSIKCGITFFHRTGKEKQQIAKCGELLTLAEGYTPLSIVISSRPSGVLSSLSRVSFCLPFESSRLLRRHRKSEVNQVFIEEFSIAI
ncbi:hypothetical protein TNCT_95571 [Trichonephila clavata]|uniref:Uncharacterized protein n=1 Tax=Trichonephila clavata TaxID=2740835 RepID=A0A8X6FCN3_TRICU|nr:hypothetical protein TNCT_95571 [Trichonephila clavata]